MNKKIEDYLPYHIGCECMFLNMKGVVTHKLLASDNIGHKNLIRPLLRPLSSMTEEDCPDWLKEWMPDGYNVFIQRSANNYVVEIDSKASDGYCLTIHTDGSMSCECKDNGEQYGYRGAEIFKHLLSKDFDLFGLIDAGLAIDKPTHHDTIL